VAEGESSASGSQVPPPTACQLLPAQWLDVERLAEIEVTSEDALHPIESALRLGAGSHRLQRIRLVFEDHEVARTQEFILRWSGDNGRTYRDIVRQHYTFSPPETVREMEDYTIQLQGVTTLAVRITPNIGDGTMRASLAPWTLA
jgi:hypothetical protein